MFKRKQIPFLLVSLFALAGCGGGNKGEEIRLKVWGASSSKTLILQHGKEFDALYPDVTIKIDFANIGEAETATNMLADVSTGADVFFFADDHLSRMVSGQVISKLPTGYRTIVENRDVEVAIKAATSTVDKEMYGYPATADNGYFLVYNKRFLNADDVKTLEGIMAKTTKDHQLIIDLKDGYYATSFIQHIGELSYNPETDVHTSNYNEKKFVDAMEGVVDILRGKEGFESDNFNETMLERVSNENNNKVIAGVTGHWNTKELMELMGDDYAAAKLPTFTSKDGTTIQMGSFAGAKLVGVKSSSKYLDYAHALAEYMTREKAQIERYDEVGYGPSNILAQANEKIVTNPALKALAEQSEFAISQAQSVGSDFWNAAKAVGEFIVDGSDTKTMQDVLDAFVSHLSTPK